jgi:predicted ATP-dependent serine protease
MANAMANYGRVEYVPAEEHFGITLTKKINRLKAYSNSLHFRRWKGFDDLKDHLERHKAKVVFIDSVSVLNENDDSVIQFAQWCRQEQIGMWMVSHANKDGSYKGSSKFGHEADIRIEVTDDGVAQTKKNRYLGELRSIEVPMKAAQIEKGSGSPKGTGKKKEARSEKQKKSSGDIDSRLDKVEQMMQV